MKKAIIPIFVCILLITTSIVIAEKNTENKSSSLSLFNLENIQSNNLNDIKKWTFMFYDAADFPGYDPLVTTGYGLTFAEAAYSGENVDVIVLQDVYEGPATMWYIDESHRPEKLEDMGEVNMANGNTLKNFITYCKNGYTSERYILAMYGHGAGIWGAIFDDTSPGTYERIDMNEMQKALTEAGGVDLLCFTAPCLMGAIECVYELRDCVDVYVGSEEFSGYTFWHDPMALLFERLHGNSDISNIDLGEKIIEWIEEDAKTNEEWGDLLTMSAIRTDKIEELATSIDKLCTYLLDSSEPLGNIKSTRSKAKEVGEDLHENVDLLDFIHNYNDIENDQIISQHLLNITESFNEAVIKECHGIEREGNNGLSIYFPISKFKIRLSKSGYYNTLDFTQNTGWYELLDAQSRLVKSKTKAFDHPLIQFLENHPCMFHMLKQLLGSWGA